MLVRVAQSGIGLTLSLRSDGDIEAFFGLAELSGSFRPRRRQNGGSKPCGHHCVNDLEYTSISHMGVVKDSRKER